MRQRRPRVLLTNQSCLTAGTGLMHQPLHLCNFTFWRCQLSHHLPYLSTQAWQVPVNISQSPKPTSSHHPPPVPNILLGSALLTCFHQTLDTKSSFATPTVSFVILHHQITNFKHRLLRNRYVPPVHSASPLLALLCPPRVVIIITRITLQQRLPNKSRPLRAARSQASSEYISGSLSISNLGRCVCAIPIIGLRIPRCERGAFLPVLKSSRLNLHRHSIRFHSVPQLRKRHLLALMTRTYTGTRRLPAS